MSSKRWILASSFQKDLIHKSGSCSTVFPNFTFNCKVISIVSAPVFLSIFALYSIHSTSTIWELGLGSGKLPRSLQHPSSFLKLSAIMYIDQIQIVSKGFEDGFKIYRCKFVFVFAVSVHKWALCTCHVQLPYEPPEWNCHSLIFLESVKLCNCQVFLFKQEDLTFDMTGREITKFRRNSST